MSNPFTIAFGKKPGKFVSRPIQTNNIIEDFTSETPASYVYMLTGVRGSGKTVMMTSIAREFSSMKDWVVLELNPARDLLEGLAARLYGQKQLQHLFLEAKINLTSFGIGVSIEGASPVADIEVAVSRMLKALDKHNKRVLITIDEVTNTENMRIFVSAFQIFLRQDLPVFLLMTGLYENIYELQNVDNLTFLYRAPKVFLEPLNYSAIRSAYQKVFDIDNEEAGHMADIVKGYPFAFQLLGYLYWNERSYNSLEDIMPEFDQYLSEYVYEKIWSEMSATDHEVAYAIASENNIAIKDLRQKIENMSSEKLSVYRERLKRKGILDTATYGHLSFLLPRFDEFVKNMR